MLRTPQDLPSTGTPPPGPALCAAPPVTLWVSQGAPQTTCPVHHSGVQSRAGGSRTSPDPHTPPSSRGVGLPCPAAGAWSTRHTQPPSPPHTPQQEDRWGRTQVCRCALTLPSPPQPPPPPLNTGTAVSPSPQCLGGGLGTVSSLGGCETRQPEVGTESCRRGRDAHAGTCLWCKPRPPPPPAPSTPPLAGPHVLSAPHPCAYSALTGRCPL